MYYPTIENDVQGMISKYYSKGIQIGEPTSQKLPAPKILMRSYVLPFPVKDIIFTRTRQGITNSHALLLTTHNQILTVPGMFLDPRRPTGEAGKENPFEDSELPPYDAIIPITYTSALSYNLRLSALSELLTLPHDYESTTLVVASGVDTFVSYFAPEKV